jgi:hypothetical protein
MEEIQTSSEISKKSWHVFNFNTFELNTIPTIPKRCHRQLGHQEAVQSRAMGALPVAPPWHNKSSGAQQRSNSAQSSSIVVMIPSKTTTAQPASEETTFVHLRNTAHENRSFESV